jgi:hypothetical protein
MVGSRAIVSTQGVSYLVDADDYERLSQHRWQTNRDGYAQRSVRLTDRMSTALMHREVLGLQRGDGRLGDHISGDKRDNRRANLRVATPSQNVVNTAPRASNKSGVTGVFFNRHRRKWCATLRANGKNVNLGNFDSLELAAEFRHLAAAMVYGEFAPAVQ